MIVSESEFYDENDVDARESTESVQTEDKYRHSIMRVLRRVFSIELVALMYSFSSGLHSVIRLSVQHNCK